MADKQLPLPFATTGVPDLGAEEVGEVIPPGTPEKLPNSPQAMQEALQKIKHIPMGDLTVEQNYMRKVLERWDHLQFRISLEEAMELKFVEMDEAGKTIGPTVQKQYQKTLEDLRRWGFNTKEDVAVFNQKDQISKMFDRILAEEFNTTNRIRIGNNVKALITTAKSNVDNSFKAHPLYIFPGNAVSDYEDIHRGMNTGFNFQDARKGSFKTLPKHEDFNRVALEVMNQVKGPAALEQRIFLLHKLNGGVRDEDMINLVVRPDPMPEDIDRTKLKRFLRPGSYTLAGLSAKGKYKDYDLSSHVYHLLQDLEAQAKAAGRKKLFTKSTKTLVDGIVAPYRRIFMEEGLQPYNVKKERYEDVVFGDLRKNIYRWATRAGLAESLEAAEEILQHSRTSKTGQLSYEGGTFGEKSRQTEILDAYFEKLARDSGFVSPKAFMKSFGIPADLVKSQDIYFSGASDEEVKLAKIQVETAKVKTELQITQEKEAAKAKRRIKNQTTNALTKQAKKAVSQGTNTPNTTALVNSVAEETKTIDKQLSELTDNLANPSKDVPSYVTNMEDPGHRTRLTDAWESFQESGDREGFDAVRKQVKQEIKTADNLNIRNRLGSNVVFDPQVYQELLPADTIKDLYRQVADSVAKTGKAVVGGVAFAWNKLPQPVKKAIPILGAGVGAWVVYQRAMEDRAKYPEGEWPPERVAKYVAQGAEEIFSIIPLTTTDFEEINEWMQTEDGRALARATSEREQSEIGTGFPQSNAAVWDIVEQIPSFRETPQFKESLDIEDPEGLTAIPLEQQMQDTMQTEPSTAGLAAVEPEEELAPFIPQEEGFIPPQQIPQEPSSSLPSEYEGLGIPTLMENSFIPKREVA